MGRLVNIAAIIIGFISDLVATILFGVACTLIASVFFASQGIQGEELESRLLHFLSGRGYMFFSVVTGLGFTMMGGYIAGRIARQGELFHAGAVGLINILFGLSYINHYPGWYVIVILLIIPAALLGGDLSKNHNREKRDKSPPGLDA